MIRCLVDEELLQPYYRLKNEKNTQTCWHEVVFLRGKVTEKTKEKQVWRNYGTPIPSPVQMCGGAQMALAFF